MSDNARQAQLSPVLIHLLKGVIYQEQSPVVWDDLLRLQADVMDYMKKIGLELHVDEREGYAYLKQVQAENDEDGLPRLVQRRAMSYPLSLLCALLRKKLIEADASGEQTRLVLTHEQMVEMMKVYFTEGSNEVFTEEKIEAHINKVQEFGFLRLLKSQPPAYEVRRIIKALVDADWLNALDEKMKVHQDNDRSIL